MCCNPLPAAVVASVLALGGGGGWLGAAPGATAAPVDGPQRFEYAEPHMGTGFRIVLYAPDSGSADEAAKTAFATVAQLDARFSDYRADSEIALLTAGYDPSISRPVSPELWNLLVVAKHWSERTGGAFDVTVGPLTRLWRWSARRGEMPDPARLSSARGAVGHRHLVLDPAQRAVRLRRTGMALDLGGIAKGWAADAALAQLRARGLGSALVDAGGDVVLGDPPPGAAGWRVQLADGEVLVLSNVAVATSGDRYRYAEIDGVRRSHVIDPRTGLGVPDAPSVTVVAADATTADVLASALTVMHLTDGAALLAAVPAAARVSGSHDWQTDSFPWPRPRPDPGVDR